MDWTELPLPDSDRDRTWSLLESVRDRLPFTGHALSPIVGGRSRGLAQLKRFDSTRYASTRGRTGADRGASGLSPWIRHGLVTLPEVRTEILRRSSGRPLPTKYLQELAWREYFLAVRRTLGDQALWNPVEAAKLPLGDNPLPDDIRFGNTGLACIDDNIDEIRTQGTMVNQARMWVASYVVHHRRVRWQDGAAWFLQHLLDGDPASNNLSWQWVASTFSHKPYAFERGGVERQGDHCSRCPKARRGCPFESPKERRIAEWSQRALPTIDDSAVVPENESPVRPTPLPHRSPDLKISTENPADLQPDLLWIHGDHLCAPANPLLDTHPDAPAVFVLDTTLASRSKISAKRFGFLLEGIGEALTSHPGGGRILVGDPALVLPQIAGGGRIATTATLGDRFAEIVHAVRHCGTVLETVAAPSLVPPDPKPAPMRFSRWWPSVESTVLGGQAPLPL